MTKRAPVKKPYDNGRSGIPLSFYLKASRWEGIVLPLIQGWLVSGLARKALKGMRGLPLLGSLRMLSLGFLPDKQISYGLGPRPSRRRAALYLSDVQYRRMWATSAARLRCRRLLDDKVRFAELVSAFAATPKILAAVQSGTLFPLSPDLPSPDAEGLIAAARACGGLVFKPRDGTLGQGVFFLVPSGGSLLVNREPVQPVELEARIRDLHSYIITPMVRQAPYAAALFPETVNTVRVVTMVDPANGEAFVALTAQRIGSRDSYPTDNISGGGLLSDIDLATGRMTAAVRKDNSRHSRHPDTGAQIEGVVVPRWQELLGSIRNLAQRLDFLEYVGWDVVVTDDGFSVIEGNYNPMFVRCQIHRPLLADERVRAFYRHHLSLRRSGRRSAPHADRRPAGHSRLPSRLKGEEARTGATALLPGARQAVPVPRPAPPAKTARLRPLPAATPLDIHVSTRLASFLCPLLQAWYTLVFVRDSLKDLKGYPLPGSLRMITLGFFPNRQKTFGLGQWPSSRRARLFFSDARRMRMPHRSAERVRNRLLCVDKARFAELVSGLADTPKLLAVIEAGRLYPASPLLSSPSSSALAATARACDGIVLKPRGGSGGNGIFFLVPSGGELLLDRAPCTPAELDRLISRLDSYIVTTRVRQARYAEKLFPKATNTIRVVTMVDPRTGEPFVARAVHRIGAEASFPVDNYGPGGLYSYIDLSTGRLSAAVRKDGSWHSRHPDSGAQIEGIVVPRWTELMESVRELARKLDFLEYMGWDLVVTEDGFTVIEGNGNPQLHQRADWPLLADERVRAFYRHHLSGRRRSPRVPDLPAPADPGRVHLTPLIPTRRLKALLPLLRAWHVYRLFPAALRGLRGLPLAGSLRMLALGFVPERQVSYGLGPRPSKRQAELFLSDFQRRRLFYSSVNRVGCRHLLDDKVRFAELVSGLAGTPKLLAVIQSGRLFRTAPDLPTADAEGLIAAARACDGLVIKPRAGTQGSGVFILSSVKGELRLDREPVRPAELEAIIRGLDSCIVTTRVRQAGYAAGLYPHTTNTLRVLTMVDPTNREAFVSLAAQRIGTETSYPTDNVSRGGLISVIDLATGRLSAALAKDGSCHERHPDTGVQLEGFAIPGWAGLVESVLRLARELDFLEYVGWDLVITDNGLTVIEGNYSPGFDRLQMHGPLLADERVRAFYRYHLSARNRGGA